MNDTRTIAELERSLQQGEPELLRPSALAAIRAQGQRRRRARTTATLAGVAAAAVVASLGVASVTGGEARSARDGDVAEAPSWSPSTLKPLARRVLTEIPGAVQVSDSQVVIPEPDGAKNELAGLEIEDDWVEGARVDLGAHGYRGVTAFEADTFPAWLHDAVADAEAGSDMVGTLAAGVLVDSGPTQLACVRTPFTSTFIVHHDDGTIESKPSGPPAAQCTPMVLERANGTWTLGWTMVTDGFLQPGQGLQLFSADTYASGAKDTVWIGGTHGTDVASVELVGRDGSSVQAEVESGTVSPGNTMFWTHFAGTPAKVITRDADGHVLEEHATQSCADLGIVDCEVR